MILAINDLPIPIVCAVQGAAAGLGMALALSCDFVVADRAAYFMAPFARLGLIPDGGVAWILARAIGRVRAIQLLMTAEKLSAQKACDWGLISQLAEDDKLTDAAWDVAEKLSKGPTLALAGIRRLVGEAGVAELGAALSLERDLQRKIPATLDCQEGNAAFREKRAPRFVGR
ncbi:enoyl-CoA hydratase-related protein [Sphingobium sp. HWE2-09]|uniref:enoyl-CoA hydratase-related protein n=1 Tax=Sphingobium sp. HWE2-09 TaxID=3108390 RepID=UPI002DCF3B2A|nr:enoyl-CoA hydratase-related protein [Sphingobium sp. HWE2-09]